MHDIHVVGLQDPDQYPAAEGHVSASMGAGGKAEPMSSCMCERVAAGSSTWGGDSPCLTV